MDRDWSELMGTLDRENKDRYKGARARRAARMAQSIAVSCCLKLSKTRIMLPQANIKRPPRHVRVLHHG